MISWLKNRIKGGDTLTLSITTYLYDLIGRNKFKIKGKNNVIFYKGNYLKRCNILIIGNDNEIILERNGVNLLQHTKIRIYGNKNRIIIGRRNTFINGDLHIEDDNNEIKFVDNNSVLGFTHVAAIEGKQITFGSGCLFSTDVIFRVGDSHSILDATTNQRINPSKSITIGDRVWFGNKTIILKGVVIGNDSIVATGTIVTKSFTDGNVIIGGHPAGILKSGIKWKGERI